MCAVCFAVHILVIDHFTAYCDGVKLSCLQFLFAGIISTICMFIFEDVDFAAILSCACPCCTWASSPGGVGYTLQILAQKDSNPTVVTILLSLESVFAVIAGAIILKQQMTVREYIGAPSCSPLSFWPSSSSPPGKKRNNYIHKKYLDVSSKVFFIHPHSPAHRRSFPYKYPRPPNKAFCSLSRHRMASGISASSSAASLAAAHRMTYIF